MKIKITLKDPDGFYECVQDAVNDEVKKLNLDKDEHEAILEHHLEKTWEKLEKWVEYQEYVTIEFDLEANTATVVPK